jgi:DNA-binding Lrp family transcriptional regulator/YHS domain-containing protein
MNLDETDVNILKVLQENGRLSFRQIAEKVKVSVPTISNKIAAMENAGVIKGYTAIMDTEKLGEMSVIITIKAKPSELKIVADKFSSDLHVRSVFLLSNGKILLLCTFTEAHLINDFVSRLGEIPEIMEYEIANIIGVVREGPRTLIKTGLSVIMQCAYCKKEIRDEGTRVKLDGKDYYLCCPTCTKAFQEKNDRIKSKASPGS